jgi:outer membrane protein OmpA-like peptidoglycan-associated protein
MDGSKTMKKYVRVLGATLALIILALPGRAAAQELSRQQIVTTLGRVTNNAPAIDVVVLAQEAEANVGKGVASLPDYANLAKLSQLIVEINFENDSVAMEPASYRTIGLIADALHHPNLFRYKFLVVGHSSSTGDALHNLKLSQQRADAIRVALATTFAVPADRLFSVGVGQEWPIDPANPKGAINRRVNLINLGIVK